MSRQKSLGQAIVVMLAMMFLVGCAPVTSTPIPPTPTPQNRAPIFPDPFTVDMKTEFEYDNAGRVIDGVTTITILTPAIDPDGDTLTYIWEGEEFNHRELTTFESKLEYDDLSAAWDRTIVLGEPASGTITVTVNDGRGGTVSHKFCIGERIRC